MKEIEELSQEQKKLLELHLLRKEENDLSELIKRNERDKYPLSFSQQRLWLIDQLLDNKSVYNVPVLWELEGDLNRDLLNQSINDVVSRHESLRTSFSQIGDRVEQKIESSLNIYIPEYDFCDLPEDIKDIKVQDLMEEELKKSFDLKKAPLIRGIIIKKECAKYLLLLNLHHAITDGKSMTILMKEIASYYNSYRSNEEINETNLPIQYGDFSLWQKDWLENGQLNKQLTYWKEKLKGELPVIQLPTDYKRSSIPTYNGATLPFSLSKEMVDGIKKISMNEGVTPYMFLLSIYKILLYRYTNIEDIIVGTPISNRNQKETEHLIGLFINTLVLRTGIRGDLKFLDLLKMIRKTTLEAFENQDIPFEKLVEEISPEQRGASPFFQVAFTYQSHSASLLNIEGLKVKRLPLNSKISKFELTLAIAETTDGINAVFEYNTDLFALETINRMKNHFLMILNEIIKNPEKEISSLNMLTNLEVNEILVDWNSTKVELTSESSIHKYIEKNAQNTPELLAIVTDTNSITYKELNDKSNQLARYLVKLGIKENDPVLVYLDRDIDMIISFLAILKAGGAYIPTDSIFPPERINKIALDASVKVVISQKKNLNFLFREHVKNIFMDSIDDVIAEESTLDIQIDYNLNSLAYIIFTSGSTGEPKGVKVPHLGLKNLVQWTIETFNIRKGERSSQYFRSAFDGSVWEIWTHLTAGSTIYFCNEDIRLNPIEIKEWLVKNKINFAIFPPTIVKELTSLRWSGEKDLRYIFTGSDRVYESDMNDIPFKIINAYGPTEASVISTYSLIEANKPPHIGKPIYNTQIFILDPSMNPVPIGVPGEIYISGHGLAQGYLNRKDTTKETFINHTFKLLNRNFRLYKTGDIAKYLPDGNIEFIGRKDNQVKIRGYRIELGEIETILSDYQNIKESLVLVKEENFSKQLVAFCVLSHKPLAVDEQTILSYLKTYLPDYMIPTSITLVDSWPLTANGKIDRKCLLQMLENKEITKQYTKPKTSVEKNLYKIWSQILGKENFGINDDFFQIGGHSLLLAKVKMEIYSKYKIEVPLKKLFEFTTIVELAKEISNSDSSKKLGTIKKSSIKKTMLPASFAQKRLWFLDNLIDEKSLYNTPLILNLSGNLDPVALSNSIEQVINRHESLRTTFVEHNTDVLQVISSETSFDLTVHDLSILEEVALAQNYLELLETEIHHSFDLEKGPLIRACLIRKTSQDHVLLVNMHHAITDGWSMDIFVRELNAFYEKHTAGKSLDLPELPIQYGDYATWQKDWLKEKVLANQLAYWKEQLRGELPVLQLPMDRQRPAKQTFNGNKQSIVISTELVQALKALNQKAGTTSFMTLLAAFKVLLHRYSGQNDLLVGTPISNRNKQEIENLIGFFVNTLVIRTEINKDFSFMELLKQVRETALEAYTHQDVPFERVVEEIQPARSLSHSPLFQTMFSYHNTSGAETKIGDLEVQYLQVQSKITKEELIVGISESNKRLTVSFEYNTDLFNEETIDRMLTSFHLILQDVVEKPEALIGDLEILSKEENDRIVQEWNQTEDKYPSSDTLHQLFEKQVEQSPDAPAVVFGNQSLTYSELNNRANRLFYYLQKEKSTTPKAIGIYLERGIESIVSQLAILKLGCAYVPLDPSYPDNRISYMIENSNLQSVITLEKYQNNLSHLNLVVYLIDKEQSLICQESSENFATTSMAKDLAYIIYTSGSTGKPKGVMVPHENVVNLVNWQKAQYDLHEGRKVTHLSNPAFDASIWEIYPTLCTGATLYIVEEEKKIVPEDLKTWLLEKEINVSFIPTPLIEPLVELKWPKRHSLNFVLTGGDQLRLSKEIQLPFTLVNHYGPTETTVLATAGVVKSKDRASIFPDIGKPISNTQTYVLDKSLNITPVGVTGELYIGGAGVALGYMENNEQTHKHFVSNPFTSDKESRLYKTGDLVKYLPDGRIQFVGRSDNQVSMRGYRVELGEIESVLNRIPTIQHAKVISIRSILVAYIVTKKNISIENKRNSYKEHLKSILPEYMLPKTYIELNAIPLTKNGKSDTFALEKLFEEEKVKKQEQSKKEKPKNEIQKKLVKIWSELLGNQNINLEDNFFELGGDSILSLRVVSKSKEEKIFFTVRDLFANQTILELSKIVMTENPYEIAQKQVTGNVMLTPIQKWFFENSVYKNHFNMAHILEVEKNVTNEMVENAFQFLVNHHDSLRTVFEKEQSNISLKPNFNFHYEKLDEILESNYKAYITKKADSMQAAMNIGKGPLIQIGYFETTQQTNNYLFIAIHHLIVDAVSWRIILEDIENLLKLQINRKDLYLPEKTTSYKEWSQFLHSHSKEFYNQEVEFWKKQNSNQDFPIDFQVGENTFESIQKINKKIDLNELFDLITETKKFSLQEILITALVKTIGDYTRFDNVLLNLESHGREEVLTNIDLSRTVGWFTSMYPLSFDSIINVLIVDLLVKVKSELEIVPNKGIGFGILKYLMKKEGRKNQLNTLKNPQISFNYFGNQEQSMISKRIIKKSNLYSNNIVNPNELRSHFIDISCQVNQKILTIEWVYSKNLHDYKTIKNLAELFENNLESLKQKLK
ncbi:amino acid adenylation domain-containing protein [Psychrobacillus glaciei]|uniref:Amino acid adenylation domain-containing protein n=1 Tax=Psychrobacillus glaciei TaxID=2283160 RepID=A0A5J6SR25_9BACI|nr:non-ribosomal peptide synthetase [Psychrobacillus glaciei]QFG00391.1 amino acid adenylation domain-containing protein [Psychrobacillus glaciei]